MNNYGQTGISANAGEDGAVIEKPALVRSLTGKGVREIACGLHHSIACGQDGTVWSWGRCDDGQPGVPIGDLSEEEVVEGKILLFPTEVKVVGNAKTVAAGIDNSFAVTDEGEVYAWGFSGNYRTGLGTDETVDTATLVENSAIKGKEITFAGCGGQFSVLAGPASEKRSGA